jgi:transcriptional coactivator p15 (PC4)
MSDECRPVYAFDKNTREQVRATLGEFGGFAVASLRVWVQAPGSDYRPTTKGITLRVEHLAELRRAVDALIGAVRETAREGS